MDAGSLLVAVAAGTLASFLGGLLLAHRSAPAARLRQLRHWFGEERMQRRANKTAQAHAELVNRVLGRSSVLGDDIPVEVSGSGEPTLVRMHPSGTTRYWYSSMGAYIGDVTRGGNAQRAPNAMYGPRPKPVASWSSQRLKTWLAEREDRGPV